MRRATSSASCSTDPSRAADQRPSGVYARSANASVSGREPGVRRRGQGHAPGQPEQHEPGSTAATAAATARGRPLGGPTALYSAPCGFT